MEQRRCPNCDAPLTWRPLQVAVSAEPLLTVAAWCSRYPLYCGTYVIHAPTIHDPAVQEPT